MRIGIFGGCFSPPHIMHRKIVSELLKQNYLDKVIVVPTGNYYEKSELVDIEHRLNMLGNIFRDDSRVIVSDLASNPEYQYTYETLDYFKDMYKDAQIYFICGSDNLNEFKSWKNYEYILENYRILVINRNSFDREKLSASFKNYKESIVFTNIEESTLSSSIIRNFIHERKFEEVKNYLDDCVLDYIIQKNLYRGDIE